MDAEETAGEGTSSPLLTDPDPRVDGLLPPRRSGPGLRPALAVVGLAVVLVLGFGVLAVVTNVNTPGPSSHPFKAALVPGTSLVALPATNGLRPIETLGEPPGNIIDSVSLPQGARRVSVTNNGGNADQYDQQMTFSLPTSQAELVTFYQAEMKRLGWKIFSTGPATGHPGTIEVLGQLGGTDGWYWEMGALIAPTVFSPHPTANGGDVTHFTVRLFQEPDQD
jgi:hypothetical protein